MAKKKSKPKNKKLLVKSERILKKASTGVSEFAKASKIRRKPKYDIGGYFQEKFERKTMRKED